MILPLQKPAKYGYSYSAVDVGTGVNLGHDESRDGDYTSGSYSVHLPDGRIQHVTYSVDADGGYVATVTYDGEAQYPDVPPRSYGP